MRLQCQKGTKMRFDSSDYLNEIGFMGFRSVRGLFATCSEITDESGVYLVLHLGGERPEFVPKGVGGYFKKKDPNVSIAKLESNWVDDTITIYIGQTEDSLKRRISRYMKFGQGYPVGHWGGRYIWQIHGYQDLILCWMACHGEENAKQTESEMLREFRRSYGCLPFANCRQ